MPANDAFQNALRDALNHLYDPDRLRTSPLAHIFALPLSSPLAAQLQQILLESIHAIQPPPGEPAASIRRRVYNILQLRYEQQFSQKEVASQMGLGVRQYRRLQQAALQALTLHLSEQFDLTQPIPGPTAVHPTPPVAELPETLQWISKLARDETARVDYVLEDVARLVGPLARRHDKSVRLEEAPPVSGAIHPMVLRQALLNLLNAAILHSANDEIVIRVRADYRQVKIAIFNPGAQQLSPAAAPVMLSELAIAQTMIHYFGGDLSATTDASMGDFYAELRCRSTGLTPVLVVDDHMDTLELLQRYTAGTPYTLIVVNNPQQALEMAAMHLPCAILLDVMMPEMDGWEVLTRLKQDERTAHLPVLVCTILDQSELAMSLGASGFLRKPVTRQALLAALGVHGAPPASESW